MTAPELMRRALAERMASAGFSFVTVVASMSGTQFARVREWLVMWIPVVQTMSLSANGMPCVGPC
jgi:hypothetical protein